MQCNEKYILKRVGKKSGLFSTFSNDVKCTFPATGHPEDPTNNPEISAGACPGRTNLPTPAVFWNTLG